MDKYKMCEIPNTRFQGSKKKIISKIFNLMTEHFEPSCVLDLFGGSSVCSLYFQINNINVIYNDILKFNCINANGFLHNNTDDIPDEKEIKDIFIKKDKIVYNTFIQDTFEDIYYTNDENKQLDIFKENIKYFDDNKKNIMLYLMFQSAISKRPYNLFHRKNLSMRTSNVKRNFGNKTTWEKTFVEHMLKFRKELIRLYEQKEQISLGNINIINMSYDEIPSDIMLKIDTVYIDPPYFKKNVRDSQYFNNYHFLEGFIRDSWNVDIDYSTKNLKLKTSDKYVINDANKMFDDIINKFSDKNLVISYNTNSFPSVSDIEKKLNKKFKTVITKHIDHRYVLSKKLSKEVLILALVI